MTPIEIISDFQWTTTTIIRGVRKWEKQVKWLIKDFASLWFLQQFPPRYPESDLNNRFGDGYNGNRYGSGYDGNNYQNPYDAEYERRMRIETEKLRQLMIEFDKKNSAECTLNVAAQWNFETNVNEVTQLEAVSTKFFPATADIDLNTASHSRSYPIIEIFSMLTRMSCAVGNDNCWFLGNRTRDCDCSRFHWFTDVYFQLTAQQRYSDYMRSIFDQLKNIDQSSIYDEKLYRQVKLLSSIGPSALPADQLDRVGLSACFQKNDWR